MKFLFYTGRHGQQLLTEHSEKAWEFLKAEMQKDNRCTFEEAIRDFGHDCLYGSFGYSDRACLSMDDGGQIITIDLTEVPDAK